MPKVKGPQRTRTAQASDPHLISVSPTPGGWTVTADAVEVMVFSQGGQAERSARRLGAAMAKAGHPAEVRIHLKDGSLAGRHVCAASGRV